MTETQEMTEERYTSRVERLHDRILKDRMQWYLYHLAAALREAWYDVDGPADISDDCYCYSAYVTGNGLATGVDIRVQLSESLAYEGTTGGVNMSLDIVADDGEILGGLCPYNYTPDVWVPVTDVRGIMERWSIITGCDTADIIGIVDAYAERAKAGESYRALNGAGSPS